MYNLINDICTKYYITYMIQRLFSLINITMILIHFTNANYIHKNL